MEKQELARITSRHFDVLPREELGDPVRLSKRINAFVYNYCTCEPPLELNIRRLLVNCRTSCGGYVHVFRQIAGRYGITSRPAYLFNIPFQGNHNMVEIRYGEGKWALFDPTFGTFFTPDGDPAGMPYSLDDLYFLCTADTLVHNITQARKTDDLDVSLPIEALYARNSFHACHMEPWVYLRAEDYGPFDTNEYSLLRMNIDMREGLFQFGGPVLNTLDGEKKFLTQTNTLLNDEIQGNHVSYNMSYLGEFNGHTFKNLYGLSNLRKDRIYRITLHGTNVNHVILYLHFTDSRAVLQHSGRHTVPEGIYETSMLFRARDTRADLILEVYPGTKSFLRIFGVRVAMCGQPGNASCTEPETIQEGPDRTPPP